MSRSKVRVIIPDSHGEHIHRDVARAVVRDIRRLDPDEIVGLGDHTDCGGVFSTHQRSYTLELTESYEDDCATANWFFDLVQAAAPRAETHIIEGNHEAHVERWAARTFTSHKDAKSILGKLAPDAMLNFKSRGIRYYRRSEFYQGLSIQGTIRLGKCFFTHGISHAKNAADVHLAAFNAPVVFGHVHRAQESKGRTVTSFGLGAWCPGTLAKLQPLYRHTTPTKWTHGYAVQFVNPSGLFLHVNVPILKGGISLLGDLARRAA